MHVELKGFLPYFSNKMKKRLYSIHFLWQWFDKRNREIVMKKKENIQRAKKAHTHHMCRCTVHEWWHLCALCSSSIAFQFFRFIARLTNRIVNVYVVHLIYGLHIYAAKIMLCSRRCPFPFKLQKSSNFAVWCCGCHRCHHC